jgi:hypothetical protein
MTKHLTVEHLIEKCFGGVTCEIIHWKKLARAARRFVRMEQRNKEINGWKAINKACLKNRPARRYAAELLED